MHFFSQFFLAWILLYFASSPPPISFLMVSLNLLAYQFTWCGRDCGQRKILPNSRTNQIAGFVEYWPLAHLKYTYNQGIPFLYKKNKPFVQTPVISYGGPCPTLVARFPCPVRCIELMTTEPLQCLLGSVVFLYNCLEMNIRRCLVPKQLLLYC